MYLLCLSISHHNSPVELRECLSLPIGVISEAVSVNPIRKEAYESIMEMVILSTCNRMEVYALVSSPEGYGAELPAPFQPVQEYLERALQIPVGELEPYFRLFEGDQAVEHLFQVASGLDSIAIGETQILGQVSRALDEALHLGMARHVLSSLFRSAIHAGKRVHNETEIGRQPTSISQVAVQLAKNRLGSLSNLHVLVIGAGKMGRLAIQILKEEGAGEIFLTNRTHQHAVEMASQTGCSVLSYNDLPGSLEKVDLVFTSTSAITPILQRTLMDQVMAKRRQKSMLLVDLSVPRNVDPSVRQVPNVRVLDMDDLQVYAENAGLAHHSELSEAKKIVASEVSEYEKLLRIIPFIGELHKKIEAIRQNEVERAMKTLKNADPQVRDQMDLFSRSLVRKILHEPTMHLRMESDQETLNDYVDALSRLFDLGDMETYSVVEVSE
jgi:glutamyl-tRNA reductase